MKVFGAENHFCSLQRREGRDLDGSLVFTGQPEGEGGGYRGVIEGEGGGYRGGGGGIEGEGKNGGLYNEMIQKENAKKEED